MTSPYEGKFDDLFDFPEVEGLEDFGLVPPVRTDVDLTDFDGGAPAPAAATEPDPQEAADAGSTDEDRSFISEARPNPPVPEGVTDLDEDLFSFDELFSLDDDPFYNGTLGADGAPVAGVPAATADPASEHIDAAGESAAPADDVAPEGAAASDPAEVPAAAAPDHGAAASAASAGANPEPLSIPRPAAGSAASNVSSEPGRLMQAGAALDRGPRILLPEDVPYGGRDHGRTIWALVACFLIVNTGIFWMAHLASSNVNSSIAHATEMIAGAIATKAPATEGPSASVPVAPTPGVTYTVSDGTPEGAPADETGAEEVGVEGDVELDAQDVDRTGFKTPKEPETYIDARDYTNTHALAVGSAKAMLADGRFEDARRVLNNVLANQARVPLAPSLREEIDYLIPLTYFEQGRATAPDSDPAGGPRVGASRGGAKR